MPRRRALQLIGGIVAIALLASATWTVVAIRTVAPRTSPANFFAQGALAQKIKQNERINVLFLAHGGAGNDNHDFTDTMLVLSIRPETHRATVISLPRYLWVKIPAPSDGDVEGKLYSAYAIGASTDPTFLRAAWRTSTGQGDLAAATVAQTIGQSIDAWIAVDLMAFEALIDAIGGIKVEISETLDDPDYPSDVDERTIHIHFDPGMQTLDGKRALQYARSRLSTSEADRARRQEIVLFAILERLKEAGLGPGMIAAAGTLKDGLRTNMTPSDANELRHLLAAIRKEDVKRITLEDSPMLTSRTLATDENVLVPADATWKQLQSYLAGELP
jgi:LCP family protein required for cell wall assembly